ncbi:MAG: FAD-binding oxidoreductase [Paracoccaceae bacterium]
MLAAPTHDDLARLHGLLGEAPPADPVPQRYLEEPRDKHRGHAATVLRPSETAGVAAVVAYCAERRIPVIPYAGGTGLVGGQLTDRGPPPVILSLERLDRIRRVSAEDDAIVAEAGVILADIQRAAEGIGRLFPLSLASEGSCRIGGNLATNAGGVQVLRYGNARDLCLGIEAVLPDGSIHHGLRLLRKDNTGYDLRHLLIGSEGTLGIITAAALKVFPRPGETVTAMLAVPSPAAALTLLHRLRAEIGDLTAFELIARQGIRFLAEHYPEKADPLESDPAWRVLLEATGPGGTDLAGRLEAALAGLFEEELATDGTIAASEAQRQHLWWMRETIPEANRKVGAISSHDLSVPMTAISRFIEEARTAMTDLDPELRINCFGHIGDGNLHFNLFPPEGRARQDYANLSGEIMGRLHEVAHRLDGSISAEHGIGRAKASDLARFGDPAKLAAMRTIKYALDPHGIMNPGAIFGDTGPAD